MDVTPPMEVMGWTPEREAAFAEHAEAGLVPGRVVSQERDVVHAITASGPLDVYVQRGFRRSAAGPGSFPTVGDWIALEPLVDGDGALRTVLPVPAPSRVASPNGGDERPARSSPPTSTRRSSWRRLTATSTCGASNATWRSPGPAARRR
ncbi:MAG: hypothetical protein H0X59_07405 [Chloroflexi bacterium]|nr:hypothetical protein [Chloroflexota bacterium]